MGGVWEYVGGHMGLYMEVCKNNHGGLPAYVGVIWGAHNSYVEGIWEVCGRYVGSMWEACKDVSDADGRYVRSIWGGTWKAYREHVTNYGRWLAAK